ncbi:hypothetical protein KH5H1_69040 [Corallococcus caeni]|nr:hypothetical protein KH5H1_69040 [Corallococcus sp. KH5-1]
MQRNPIIAEVFYRAGLIEKWGRGTNRVAEMCRAAGLSAPEFAEVTGAVVVTLRVNVGQTLAADRGELPSKFVKAMVEEGLLERTHPDNPKHPAQSYRAVRRDG